MYKRTVYNTIMMGFRKKTAYTNLFLFKEEGAQL